jgi:hypothetical protein
MQAIQGEKWLATSVLSDEFQALASHFTRDHDSTRQTASLNRKARSVRHSIHSCVNQSYGWKGRLRCSAGNVLALLPATRAAGVSRLWRSSARERLQGRQSLSGSSQYARGLWDQYRIKASDDLIRAEMIINHALVRRSDIGERVTRWQWVDAVVLRTG